MFYISSEDDCLLLILFFDNSLSYYFQAKYAFEFLHNYDLEPNKIKSISSLTHLI